MVLQIISSHHADQGKWFWYQQICNTEVIENTHFSNNFFLEGWENEENKPLLSQKKTNDDSPLAYEKFF